MNCDRFVGTGLVEVVKPIPRLRRTSSVGASYFSCQTKQKTITCNEKYFSMRAKTRFKPSMHPDPTIRTALNIPDEDILKLEETEIMFQPTPMHQNSIGNHSPTLIRSNSSRRHSFILYKTDEEFGKNGRFKPIKRDDPVKVLISEFFLFKNN